MYRLFNVTVTDCELLDHHCSHLAEVFVIHPSSTRTILLLIQDHTSLPLHQLWTSQSTSCSKAAVCSTIVIETPQCAEVLQCVSELMHLAADLDWCSWWKLWRQPHLLAEDCQQGEVH